MTDPLEDWKQANACKVCGARPDAEGAIDHGKGCYTVSAGGGGTSFVDPPAEPSDPIALIALLRQKLKDSHGELELAKAALREETDDRRRQVGSLRKELEEAIVRRDQNWLAYEKARREYDEAQNEVRDLREAATGNRHTPHADAMRAIRSLRTT